MAEPVRTLFPDSPLVDLATGRLLLRWFRPGDAPLLTELDSDPEVKRYIDDGAPARPEADRETMERICRQIAAHPGFGFLAAHRRADGAFIGWFHFRPDRESADDTDLGYRLMRAAWGQGFASEGSLALMQRGFMSQGVTRVVARAMLANTGSWGVMRKLGMHRIAEFEEERFPGADRRAVKYAITREEFALRQS